MLPSPAAMTPYRQRHDIAAAQHILPAIRSASPGQQIARCVVQLRGFGLAAGCDQRDAHFCSCVHSWPAESAELSGAPQLRRLEHGGGPPQHMDGQHHDTLSVRRASAPRVPGMSSSPFLDDEQCLTAADTPNPFAATGLAPKTGVSTNGTGSADSSGMHVASPSQPWPPSTAGTAAVWGDRPGIAANAVVRSDRPPGAAHTVSRSSLDSQGRCYPVVSGDPAVAAAEAAAAPAVPDRNSAKHSSRRAAMLRRSSLGSPNDADTSSPRRRLLRRCKSTNAAYTSDASDSDGDNRGVKKRRVKHQPADPIEVRHYTTPFALTFKMRYVRIALQLDVEMCMQEGTTNEEAVARADSDHPALTPPFEEESVATLRQEVVQLRMENASAVAHIATLEVCRLPQKPLTTLRLLWHASSAAHQCALLKLFVYADGAERTQPQLPQHLPSAQAESRRQSAIRGRDCQAQKRLGTEFGVLPIHVQVACSSP